MSIRSEEKKKHIRERARGVFAQKGFRTVTMKDIVDACGISRGGLYLYYPDTKTLFLDILRTEKEEAGGVIEEAIASGASAGEILRLFLEEQKRELLRSGDTLALATYEYAFGEKDDEYLQTQFDEAVRVIELLVRGGVRSGEFVCGDPAGFAREVMYIIEGLKICALTMGMTEEKADGTIGAILARLTARPDNGERESSRSEPKGSGQASKNGKKRRRDNE